MVAILDCYFTSIPRQNQVLTTSWSDGTPGPIAFCVAEGHISGQDIVDYNLKNYGRSMVVTSGGSSHFMTGETMMIMMEQLISPALKLQRERCLSAVYVQHIPVNSANTAKQSPVLHL